MGRGKEKEDCEDGMGKRERKGREEGEEDLEGGDREEGGCWNWNRDER